MGKIILLAGCFLFSITQTAYAHPPSKILAEYDKETKEFTVTITHPVNNPKSHFINKVDIEVNLKEITTIEMGEQQNETTQLIRHKISNIAIGDTIKVTAYCNTSGKKSTTIEVE